MMVSVMLIGLLVIGLLVAGAVGLVVVLAARNKQPSAQSVAPLPAAPVTHEGRQAILKKLADGELTKAEAEEQLSRQGSPVPESIPVPPPQSGGSKGCLIAVIVALILPIVLLVLFSLFFFAKVSHTVDYAEPVRIERPVTIHPEVE